MIRQLRENQLAITAGLEENKSELKKKIIGANQDLLNEYVFKQLPFFKKIYLNQKKEHLDKNQNFHQNQKQKNMFWIYISRIKKQLIYWINMVMNYHQFIKMIKISVKKLKM